MGCQADDFADDRQTTLPLLGFADINHINVLLWMTGESDYAHSK
jgi:hypothetical protein